MEISSDLLTQLFGFFLVVIVIGFITSYVFEILEYGPEFSSMFRDMCASGGSATMTDIEYGPNYAIVQAYVSEDLDMTYPRNTYDVLSAYQSNDEVGLRESIGSMRGLLSAKKNMQFIEQCSDKPCVCFVKTGMDYFTFEKIEYTNCFPQLYSYARDEFDNCIEDITGASAIELFEGCTNSVIDGLDDSNEANTIKDCYNYFKTHNIQRSNSYRSPNVYVVEGELDYDNSYLALSDFYDLSKAGIISEVISCTSIPTEFDCTCPYEYGNQIVDLDGVVVGITGGDIMSNNLKMNTLTFNIEQETQACHVNYIISQ